MNTTIDHSEALDHSDVAGVLSAAPLASEVAFLNARAAAVAVRLANPLLGSLGLKVRSYSVLSLAAGMSPPSQRQLAEILQLDPSQIVSLVDDLEQRGWVSRIADPADRRVNVVVATSSGSRVCAAAARLTKQAEDQALSMLSDDERDQLVWLLRKVALQS